MPPSARKGCLPGGSGFFAKIPSCDLYVAVLGQLAAAQLSLDDYLELGPVEMITLHAPLRGRAI
jgi:hypothetical protein